MLHGHPLRERCAGLQGCGSGRLPKEDVLIEYILHTIARPKDLAGVRVTVTAGPTQEALDPCAT